MQARVRAAILAAGAAFLLTLAIPTARAGVPDGDIEKITSAVPRRATASPKRPRKLLIFTLCRGFRHGSIPWGSKALEIMGRATGAFEVEVTDDVSVFRPESLARFDAVCMNNTTGELFDDPALKESLLAFVKSGKGLVGIHAATDCFDKWPEYGEMMGGYFWGHPWSENVGIKLDDPTHPLLAAFKGRNFEIGDEIYQFRAPYSRDVLRVLLSLDLTKTRNKGRRGDADYAVAWVRSYGKGRVFYCSLGHRNEIFWNPAILQHYLDGIQFAFGDLSADTTPIPLSPRSIDPYMGEYTGTYRPASGRGAKGEAKVFAQGGGSYRAALISEGLRIDLNAGGGGEAGRIDVRRTKSEDGPKGVNFAYYEGDWNNLPDFDQLTPVKTGAAGYFEIGARDRNDNFGFKFTGFFKAPEDGRYSFMTSSDDGSRLYIGSKMIVDNDGLHGAVDKTGQIDLAAGMHPITVTFFEKGGGEELKVGGSMEAKKEAKSEDAVEEGGESLVFSGSYEGVEWTGKIVGDEFTASGADGSKFVLSYTTRKSPTEGLEPPPGAIVVLPFKKGVAPSLDGWTNQSWKAMPDGSMEVAKGENRTRLEFGDMRLHLEFRIPYEPSGRGQGRGNSGVYVQDRYEVQVLDSFGLVPKSNDCGGIYKVAEPRVNACLPPLAWQTYDMTFRAARFSPDGKVTALPRITVVLNGMTIHEDIEIPNSTGGAGRGGHGKTGPIKLQDHAHPVRYRNIWFVEE